MIISQIQNSDGIEQSRKECRLPPQSEGIKKGQEEMSQRRGIFLPQFLGLSAMSPISSPCGGGGAGRMWAAPPEFPAAGQSLL